MPQDRSGSTDALQARIQQAASLHQRGLLADAEKAYEQILREDPDHFDALQLLGLLAIQTKRADRGVELLRKAIPLNPDFAEAYNNLGMGLCELSRFQEAIASFDKAIALNPDHAWARTNRDNAQYDLQWCEAMGNQDRAIPADSNGSTDQMVTPPPPLSREQIRFSYIRELIGTDARVILEIGAHHGEHTRLFLKFFPHAEIYAFEPDPRCIAKFKTRIDDPRVHLCEMALGAADGEAEFHPSSGIPPDMSLYNEADYPQGWDLSGSLHAPKTHKEAVPWCKFESSITVKVRTLDTWAREQGIGAVDFIWADMQGAEGDLVSNGKTTLAQTRYLYTEYSDEELYEREPTLKMLLEMLPNFSVVKRYPNDVLLKNTAQISGFNRRA